MFLNPDFLDSPAVLSIKKFVEWKKKNNAYNFNRLPKSAIISPLKIFSKKDLIFNKKFKGLYRKAYQMGNAVLLQDIGIGGTAVTGLMEELRFLGIIRFVFVGLAGRVNDQIRCGEVLVVNRSISYSGVSFYYDSQPVISQKNPLQNKVQAILQTDFAVSASVDSPFRTNFRFLEKLKNDKVDLLDLESASILAFGKHYHVDTVPVLIAADLLYPEWQAPSNPEMLNKKLISLVKKLSREI